MNQRSEIMNEYFVLKNELNRSNKFANLHTLLLFAIEESSGQQVLFAKLDNDQKIRICEQGTDCSWVISKENKYAALGHFLFNLIISYEKNKHMLKIAFNEYFYAEFNKLLGFK